MKFKAVSLLIIVLIAVSLSGCVKTKKQKKVMPLEISSQKKAVMVIAFKGFQDNEYSNTRHVLENANVKIVVVSSSKGEARGKLGQKVIISKTLDQVKLEDFDVLVFIGGPGALEYVNNSSALKLAQQTVKQNKILAAICIAPEILAKAGVLKGKRATVWSSLIDQTPIHVLKNGGAKYINEPVVVDKKIITGNGPEAALEFGEKIVEALK